MEWFKTNRRFAVIVGITVALPLLVLLSILGDFWGSRLEYQSDISRLEPRVARLRGLIESEQKLKKSSKKAKNRLLEVAYPQSDDQATIAAALQTSVREVVTAAGMSVGNSRIMPVKEVGGFERISLNLTITGKLDALDRTMTEISNYSPMLMVETIEIKPGRSSVRGSKTPTQSLVVSLQLLTLRVAN
ncbi:MAG: type II secretion system protein GspM [Halioglobus sp.]